MEKKKPFRENSLFRGGRPAEYNACVGDNGGRYDLYDYAHGYFAATKAILALKERFDSVEIAVDTLVYPACYNFRHSIELYLKYQISLLSQLLEEPSLQYEIRHSLGTNWSVATAACDKLGWRPFSKNEEALVAQTVADFDEIDPNGVIFRYSDGRRGEQHLKEWSLINLDVVERRANAVFQIFVDGHYRLESRLDSIRF